MKIIDLLNKIANDEEVPKKIRYNDTIYYYDEKDDNELARYRSEGVFDKWLFDDCYLNDEVEILEEDTPTQNQRIERLNLLGEMNLPSVFFKVNEIIDYLKYHKSKGDE